MKTMIDLERALDITTSYIKVTGIEQLLISDAYNRVLANDVVPPMAMPPFARSPLDGYAYRAENYPTDGVLNLRVAGAKFRPACGRSSPSSQGRRYAYLLGLLCPRGQLVLCAWRIRRRMGDWCSSISRLPREAMLFCVGKGFKREMFYSKLPGVDSANFA